MGLLPHFLLPSHSTVLSHDSSLLFPLLALLLSSPVNAYIHLRWAGVPRHRSWNNALPLRPWSRGGQSLRLDSNSTLDENNWGHWGK